MLPSNLQAASFVAYPAEAKNLAVANLAMLRGLPLSFLPSLLRELIEYDYKFPAERAQIAKELSLLSSLPKAKRQQWFQAFSQLTTSPSLERIDWISLPSQFVQQQAASLWSTHQLDAFRKAAADYGDQLSLALHAEPIPVSRLGIAIIGQGVDAWDGPLFRNLRSHGTYFENVNPANGLDLLLAGAAARAKAHPVPYGHWYIDGGQQVAQTASSSMTCLSYRSLDPIRAALLKHIDAKVERPGMGPEELRADMARIVPSDFSGSMTGDTVLDRFQVKVLTEGSGTQIFSTSFVQWTSREALRRAQPLTLLVRFTPRQRQRPMNELLSSSNGESDLDPVGSLIDADMACYYHWINQQRLPGSDQAAFLVWYEGHSQALVISPSLPRGTESKGRLDLGELLSLATS